MILLLINFFYIIIGLYRNNVSILRMNNCEVITYERNIIKILHIMKKIEINVNYYYIYMYKYNYFLLL